MSTKTNPRAITKRAMEITRIFAAPRKEVWRAWTEPEAVKQWWGPNTFTAPFVKIDLKVGGKYLYDMRSADGKDYWSTGTFRQIVPMEKLVVTDSFADEKGNIVPSTYYGMSEFPLEMEVSVTLADVDGKTEMKLRYDDVSGMKESDVKDMEKGWNETLDKLEAYLTPKRKTQIKAEPGKQELFVTRDFEAPKSLVFKAFSDPKLYVQWLGPRRMKMELEKFEPRSGGSWKYVHIDDQGNRYGFHGVYHEFSPDLMIDTFEYEGLPEKGHVNLETARLQELPGGRTRLSVQVVFQSVADRDGMLQSGMEAGMNEGYERLDELLEKMKKG